MGHCLIGSVHTLNSCSIYTVGGGALSINYNSNNECILVICVVFNFMSNQHDVVQVPLASYNDCSDDNAISNIITVGPANITLDSVGDRHYICSLGRHCESGQKLTITVTSSGGATPPVTTPSATPATPSPTTTQPDACAPTPSEGPTAGSGSGPTTPAAPNSATSLSLVTACLITMSAALAFI